MRLGNDGKEITALIVVVSLLHSANVCDAPSLRRPKARHDGGSTDERKRNRPHRGGLRSTGWRLSAGWWLRWSASGWTSAGWIRRRRARWLRRRTSGWRL